MQREPANAESPPRNPSAARGVLVILGASGDLTKRLLVPALYNLACDGLLADEFAVVGMARRPLSTEEFRRQQREDIARFKTRSAIDEARWRWLESRLHYTSGSFDDPEAFVRLKSVVDDVERASGAAGNRVLYLAISPDLFDVVNRRLAEAGFPRQDGTTRIIVEKPFGKDLASAESLNAALLGTWREEEIYRIDHYLGKETVQNVLAFRFANILFEPVWNREHVDHVQITVAEALGVEGRGGYYEESGALRDMMQSHILQLLCVVAMEPPAQFNGNALRDEKVKVLRSVAPPVAIEEIGRRTVRGQYVGGYMTGKAVPGYREEKNVNPASRTETYAAMKLEIENWRWAGVPFYLRTGKRMPRRVTEIAIEFKKVPYALFKGQNSDGPAPNVLTIRIQPDEGITLRFAAKVPGAANHLRPVRMDFQYGTAFGQVGPDAYERLIFDAILGDPSLFARRDEVETAWGIVQPLLDAWASTPDAPSPYEAGTWGPEQADALLARDGRAWRRP